MYASICHQLLSVPICALLVLELLFQESWWSCRHGGDSFGAHQAAVEEANGSNPSIFLSEAVPHLRRSKTLDGLVDSLGTSEFHRLQVAFFPNPALLPNPDLSDDDFDYGATWPEPTQQEIEKQDRIEEVRMAILMHQEREHRMQPTEADFGLNREDEFLFVGQFAEEVRECPPANKSVVEGLKEVVVLTKEDVEKGNVMCVVCKDEMQGKVKELPCSHRFHGDCIVQWFRMRNMCPCVGLSCRRMMPNMRLP